MIRMTLWSSQSNTSSKTSHFGNFAGSAHLGLSSVSNPSAFDEVPIKEGDTLALGEVRLAIFAAPSMTAYGPMLTLRRARRPGE